MPIKSERTTKLMYSLDGNEFKKFSLDDIPSESQLEITTLADSPCPSDILYNPYEHTLTFDINTSHPLISRILHILYGKSNNWLRMHGYPMIRKVG
ncbi:MAG TPA: hypothetical protein VN258_06345 [Mobilitalea sp.]|nr:hypothetical protein [Mobilitalea sp.]